MTSHDVRDMLGMSLGGNSPRPTKKLKTAASRPKFIGLARELVGLGGDNPIAIVPQASVFKKKRFANRKPSARWEWREFSNSARDGDPLQLRHWRRKEVGDDSTPQDQSNDKDDVMGDAEGGQDAGEQSERPRKIEDSAFAKFNVRVDVPSYSDDQYASNLQSGEWSKDETDYLMQLARDFDLRWTLIWDRYDYQYPSPASTDAAAGDGSNTAVIPASKVRSMEDMKARYYEVAAKMMAVQKPVQYMTHAEYSLHETMANFNPQQEKSRKEFALNSLSRSRDDAREEESLLLEVKRILARSERMNEERRELYRRLDFPSTDTDISAYKSSAGLQNLFTTMFNLDKNKKRKSLAGPEAATPTPTTANGQPPSATAEQGPNRRESIAASASGHRDSIGGGDRERPEPPVKNNKKGQQHLERRKLSEQEEKIYGITHHERLASGAMFRYDKVNKLFSHKSNQQHMRITNMLSELSIPTRLLMPTAAVIGQFEQLVVSVNNLVDLRKVSDKLETEIKIEEQRKIERDKAKGIYTGDAGDAGGEAAKGAATLAEGGGDAVGNQGAPALVQATAAEGAAATGPANAGSPGGVEIKQEEQAQERRQSTRPGSRHGSRPGSSGAHKRSASVLSTTSDKSTKRQKK